MKEAVEKTKNIIEKTNFVELYSSMKLMNISNKSPLYCEKMLNSSNLFKNPSWYNIGINEWEDAWRTIHHLHIQIIPRYKGDIENPTWGVRNIVQKDWIYWY